MQTTKFILIVSICCAFANSASAIVRCELGGKGVNPNNVNETAGLYLNGALKEKSSVTGSGNAVRTLRESFSDDGKIASRETLNADGQVTGLRQMFYSTGKLMREDTYGEPDARGRSRLVKHKEWDDNGKLIADDEILEDGSRKR